MVKAVETNLEMIRLVAGRLGELRERMVFLGGCNVPPSTLEHNSSRPAIHRVAFRNIPLNTSAQKSL
jgi:hypothetical protein